MEPQDQFYLGQLAPTLPQHSQLGHTYGAGYSPVAPGMPNVPRFGTENLPFTGNLFGRMAIPALAHQLVRGSNIAMTGYGHDQNLYDTMRSRQLFTGQREAGQMARKLDEENHMRTMRGMFLASGEGFGMNQRQFARTMSRGLGAFGSYMAEYDPDFVDQMGGFAGSATVLSRRLFDAGRYQVDPVSGRLGTSAETVNAMTRNIYQTAMKQPGRFGSLTAGQLGDAYGQLQSRGMLGSTMDPMAAISAGDPLALASAARRHNVNLSGGVGNLGVKDIDKLLGDDQVATRLRSFDATKTKNTLEQYSKAISVIKDIMGDNGDSNAPIQKIFAGLEELSMGSMNRLGAGRVAAMVGQTYALSKRVGMPIENVLAMQRHGADMAQRLGLDPSFAIGGAQAGMAANHAYRQLGMGGQNFFGAMNVNEFTQAGVNAYMTATASNSTNNLAAIVRAVEANPAAAAKDPQLMAIYKAAKGNQGEWQDSKGKMRNLSFDNVTTAKLIQGAGYSQAASYQMLRQSNQNQATINRLDLGRSIMPAQGDDFRRTMSGVVGAVSRMSLSQHTTDENAAGIAGRASEKVLNEILKLPQSEMNDPQKLQGIVRQVLSQDPEYVKLSKDAKAQIETDLSTLIPGHLDEAIKTGPFSDKKNFANAAGFFSPQRFRAEARLNQQASFDRTLREAFQPLNKGGGLTQRLVNSLQGIRSTDKAGMSQVLGGILGVSGRDVSPKLRDAAAAVEAARRSYTDKQGQIDRATGPERDRLIKEMADEEKAVRDRVSDLAKLASENGLMSDKGFSRKDNIDLDNMERETALVNAELAGIGYGFGTDVTREQGEEAFRRAIAGASREDAILLIKTRNLAGKGVPADYAAAIRRTNPSITDEDLRAKYERDVQSRTPSPQQIQQAQAELRSGNPNLDFTARDKFQKVLANRDRSLISTRADRKEVDALLASAPPGTTRAQVESALNARRLAARMGLTEQQTGKFAVTEQYQATVMAEIERRRKDFYEPNPGDVTNAGGEAAYFNRAMKKRQDGFSGMEESGDAMLLRDQEDAFSGRMREISDKLIDSGRSGVGSSQTLKDAKEIDALLAEQKNIVDSYYDGDIARARANHSSLDISKADQRETEKVAANRLREIQNKLYAHSRRGINGLQPRKGGTIADDNAAKKADRDELEALFGADADFNNLIRLMPKYRELQGNFDGIEDFHDATKGLDKLAGGKDKRDQLLKDYRAGKITGKELDDLVKRYDKGVGLGVSEEDLGRLKRIKGKVGDMFETEHVNRSNLKGQVSEYLQLFGSSAGEKRQSDLTDMLENNRDGLAGRLQDARSLAEIAKRGRTVYEGGSDADKAKAVALGQQQIPMLVREFDEASASADGLKKFRDTYGLGKDADFNDFKQKLGRQRRMLGRDGELDTSQLLSEIDSANKTAKDTKPTEVRLTGNTNITMGGTVRIEGGNLVMDTRTTGQLTNT